MSDIKLIVEKQRKYFETGITRNTDFRLRQLNQLKKIIKKYEKEILTALKKDLNKSEYEGYMAEIGMVYEEINYVMKKLPCWMKAKLVPTPIIHFPSLCKIYSEPYGIVLIMSPWNYPFQLTIEPLIGAIAAGNCAVIKPSNYSPNTSNVIADILGEVFDPSFISVIKGGREANEDLLKERFDYIFFTGSVAVGKVVMEAASKHLTPVSLELGGKSPCIVDETANIRLAAKRIVWGKFLNAGQTCVAPDYLLVDKKVKDKLIYWMKKYIKLFYGDDPCTNPDFPKIINQKHFDRLNKLISSEHIIMGGKSNKETNQIEPTILDQVHFHSSVMQEEIFGPILPVIEYDHLFETILEIKQYPKPLALYYFTTNRDYERYILKNLSFGGGCMNDTIVHLASSYMPFGGVGDSGMGGYHGKASFDTFSHKKSILKKSSFIDIPLRYPPYKDKLKYIKLLMK